MKVKVKLSKETKGTSEERVMKKRVGVWGCAKHTRYAYMKMSSCDTAPYIMNICKKNYKSSL